MENCTAAEQFLSFNVDSFVLMLHIPVHELKHKVFEFSWGWAQLSLHLKGAKKKGTEVIRKDDVTLLI